MKNAQKTINFHVSAVRTLAAPKRPCAENFVNYFVSKPASFLDS